MIIIEDSPVSVDDRDVAILELLSDAERWVAYYVACSPGCGRVGVSIKC